jgi:hypothetical protein
MTTPLRAGRDGDLLSVTGGKIDSRIFHSGTALRESWPERLVQGSLYVLSDGFVYCDIAGNRSR